MPDNAITLQINAAPSDWMHCAHILGHQIRVWSEQVDEILLTLDLKRSKGRFAVDWDRGAVEIQNQLDTLSRENSKVVVSHVDYSEETKRQVARKYFNREEIPNKDYRGGPLYSYYYGMYRASNDLILHSDSDMLYGGASQTWVSEAIGVLDREASIVFCSPLAGPPTASGALTTQPSTPWTSMPHAHLFSTMSTRVFMTRQSSLLARMGTLPMPLPSPRSLVKAILNGNPLGTAPENALSARMEQRGLHRLDFLGTGPGMWSVHPPMRTEQFYTSLPEIVRRIETGDVPDAQRGAYDLDLGLLR